MTSPRLSSSKDNVCLSGYGRCSIVSEGLDTKMMVTGIFPRGVPYILHYRTICCIHPM